jgi:uncharacterized OB-fold protein
MHIPRHWRLQKQKYRLVGEVCGHCGEKIFPPRDVCPECQKPAITEGIIPKARFEEDPMEVRKPSWSREAM